MGGENWEYPNVAWSMFGYLGVSASIAFSCVGAAYGTAKAGAGLASMGVLHPGQVMRNMIPVVMAGVLGIYGLIISVILSQNVDDFDNYGAYDGFAQFSGGLACGLSSVGLSPAHQIFHAINSMMYVYVYIHKSLLLFVMIG